MSAEQKRSLFFTAHGLVVGWALSQLTEDVEWPTRLKGKPDIMIEKGQVPTSLPDSVFHAYVEICENRALLNFRDRGRILVEDGERITVQRGCMRDSLHLQAHLFGSAIALALMQRGKTLLHASCVEKDGQAICFIGESGSGKSTAASSLLDAGYRLIADDVIAPVLKDGKVFVYPSSKSLKLETPLASSDPSVASTYRENKREDKIVKTVKQLSENRPFELRHIAILGWRMDVNNTIEVRPIRGFEAFPRVCEHIFRPEFARVAGYEPQQKKMIGMVTAGTRVSSLSRPRNESQIPRFVESVNKLVEQDRDEFVV